MDHLFYLVPFYAVLGCFVGFAAGLLGVGGGVLLVPGLYAAEKYWGNGHFIESGLMPMALATSMSVILPTAISSSYSQIKRQAVQWNAFKLMAPGLVLGVCFGIFVVSKIENDTLRLIFSFGLLAMAALIYFKKETSVEHPFMLKYFVSMPTTFGIGILATMLGIGGAILNVPYLNRAGIPLRNAIATSTVLGVVVSIPAALGFVVTGMSAGHPLLHFNLLAWVIIAPISVLVVPLGVKVSHALPLQRLKLIFAGLLVCIAIKMFFET